MSDAEEVFARKTPNSNDTFARKYHSVALPRLRIYAICK